MRLGFFFILALATTYAKEEESNEVNAPHPPLNLDSNLRKALLKALTELENEENEKKSSLGHSSHLDTSERIVEKASASALSFFASTAPTTEKLSTTTEEATAKPIVVIQRSNGLQHKPITILENFGRGPAQEEQIQTSASSSFTSSNKFSFGKSDTQEARNFNNGANSNLLSNQVKATTKTVARPAKIETTTLTTTTSTEESEAKVEDVQFFSAPLVAAFTVHQDERGLPKSVEPIYKPIVQKVEQKVKETKFNSFSNNQQNQEQIRTQLALQEKQRALEEEILRLKQQQQQQNYLIRQQQILHEQQLQIQKQKILDEQVRIRNNQQPFLPVTSTNSNQQTQLRNNEFNNSKHRGSVVSFQPSISFTSSQQQAGLLPLNAQQLPVKNPIDFHSPFASADSFKQFNYLSQQQPPSVGSVSSFNIVPSVQPQIILTAPKHHRVFRQEVNNQNFFNGGFNSNFNNYHNQQQNNNNNRFFRSNAESTFTTPHHFNRIQPPIVNQQLNHLLYNSGIIRGKQHEDLNIVSKVLSFNHFGGDFRFDGSNVNERRIPAPVIKKV